MTSSSTPLGDSREGTEVGAQIIGEVDRVLIIVGARTVITDPDFIRVRDRDQNGNLLSDIGYSPAKALAMGQLLIRLALERDPTLRELAVVKGGGA